MEGEEGEIIFFFFSPAEAIIGSLETLLTIGRRQSKQKKNSPIYSGLL